MEKSGILWHIKGRTPRKLELLHAAPNSNKGNGSSKDRHLSVAGALYSSKVVTASGPGFVAETDRDCLKTKYCVMFLVLILLFETKICFPVNLFCVYIPYCACCCWSCHLLKLLLKYFFPRKALNKASLKIIVFDSLFRSFDPSKILWEPLKKRNVVAGQTNI